MKVKHSCGHEIDASPSNARFIRKTFCYKCEQILRELAEKQRQEFNNALGASK